MMTSDALDPPVLTSCRLVHGFGSAVDTNDHLLPSLQRQTSLAGKHRLQLDDGREFLLQRKIGDHTRVAYELVKGQVSPTPVAVQILDPAPLHDRYVSILQRVPPEAPVQRALFAASDGASVYVGLRYCPDGTLLEGTVEDPRDAMRQILEGLRVLHRVVGVAHGKLSLASVGRDGAKFMIGGLDLTVDPRFVAPEALQGGPIHPSADLWSAGVILWAFLLGKDTLLAAPIPGDPIFRQLQKDAFWNHCGLSDDAIDLLRGMLQVKVEDRYTLEQVIEHPWLATGA